VNFTLIWVSTLFFIGYTLHIHTSHNPHQHRHPTSKVWSWTVVVERYTFCEDYNKRI
jgi:hypothetical protein